MERITRSYTSYAAIDLPETVQLGPFAVELDPELPTTCIMLRDGQAILCLRCGAWSFHPSDVANR
ncbi:MAG: hypothetical protein IPO81_09435 [Kouleothrix sp.]|nr:hypothetical protein [Kouleothrix sp.]